MSTWEYVTNVLKGEIVQIIDKNTKKTTLSDGLFGGDGGDRTHDLLNAIQALSRDTQNYTPDIEDTAC